jgi:hypothetical protein
MKYKLYCKWCSKNPNPTNDKQKFKEEMELIKQWKSVCCPCYWGKKRTRQLNGELFIYSNYDIIFNI